LGLERLSQPCSRTPPSDQKNRQKYTGKEYVIANRKFREIDPTEFMKNMIKITLVNTTKAGSQALAKKGFC